MIGVAVLSLTGCSGLFFPAQRDAFLPPPELAAPQKSVTVKALPAAAPIQMAYADTRETAAIKPATASPQRGRAAYADMIARIAGEAGVPVSVADAVVEVESNYNPATRGRQGEIGLMQIKLQTARELGYEGTAAELFDPETNLKYGMKYLAKAQKAGGGQLCGTMFKYQAGLYATQQTPSNVAYCDRVRVAMANG